MNPLWLIVLVPVGAVAGRGLLLAIAGWAYAAADRKARREQAGLANFPHQQNRSAA